MKKNSIITGIVYGLIAPLALFGLLWSLFGFIDMQKWLPEDNTLTTNFRDRTLALVALSINLLFIKMFKKRRFDESMRGIVIATFIAVGIWVVIYGRELLVF